jgi:nitric oxide reductase activation protein
MAEEPKDLNPQELAEAFDGRLQAGAPSGERKSLTALARELAHLPLDVARAALETSALIAGVSLRASGEFLRAVPAAAREINGEDLRSWGEMGRRLAMSDAETAVGFYHAGVAGLGQLSAPVRAALWKICLRQMTLSSTIAIDTLRQTPELAASVSQPVQLQRVFEVASDIAHRSAKHSAEFLHVTPRVFASFEPYRADTVPVGDLALNLVAAFAARAGGIATDAWTAIPAAVEKLPAKAVALLFAEVEVFLERGGSVALHVLVAGAGILRQVPAVFPDWLTLLRTLSPHGNASLIAVVRETPRFLEALAANELRPRSSDLALRVIHAVHRVAAVDAESALACFQSSLRALRFATIDQFEEWVDNGLHQLDGAEAKARRSYFALETRRSFERLSAGGGGLALDQVQQTLRLYVEGLTGRAVEIAPLSSVPVETRLGDGRTIHLPSAVNEFNDEDLDFRLYKVLAAHAAGQIEFGTYDRGTLDLRATFKELDQAYPLPGEKDPEAFSYGDVPPADAKPAKPKARRWPKDGDYRTSMALFPSPPLARRIFATLENGRIDRRLRHEYRGLARDLDLTVAHIREHRPKLSDLPPSMAAFELLFQIAMLGGATTDSMEIYGAVASEIQEIADAYLSAPDATVADTVMATWRVYKLFMSVTQDAAESANTDQEDETDGEEGARAPDLESEEVTSDAKKRDLRELFNAWNDPDTETDPDERTPAEQWGKTELPEYALEEGEVAFNYDEWDRDLSDHRMGWCRVVEKKVKRGDRSFVELARSRYRGVISSIRHQFQLMKPENLIRIQNELDGEEYDLNAVIDFVIDRRADGQQSERIYTKRLRRRRDVAVSFLLDQSSSTARTIGRHPMQPYTHPGRRIIEIEKDGLVLMSEALEAVGDVYSINGFTSEGRRNVKFYIIKDFDEGYTAEVEKRIGGITYQNNTRLGAAVRHAAARLLKQEARTRLLIVLSDGRPYDHDYGDSRYAREDTRAALRQAKVQGIIPFCITIDRESETELKDLYGDVGYTIIDDVLSLPERLPGIYRRLTT